MCLVDFISLSFLAAISWTNFIASSLSQLFTSNSTIIGHHEDLTSQRWRRANALGKVNAFINDVHSHLNTSKNILLNDRDVSASVHGIWRFAKPTGSRWGQRGWNQGLEESHHIIAKSLSSSSLIRSCLTRISIVAIPDIFHFWCATGLFRPKSAQIRDKIAKMGQNFTFSVLKNNTSFQNPYPHPW